MTPLAGFIAAILAGWIIREPRRAAAAILVPFLAVLAVQTWTLAAGHGDNPPSTINAVSYWVVQAIILAVALGIATQLASVLRARSAAGDGAGASRRALQATAVLLAVTAASLTGIVLDSKPVLHHNANSPLPWYGAAGILACVASLVVLTVLRTRQRRAGARQKLAVSPGTTVASGRR
jgi:formate-dependent nitrite reductase membrane component NrfD